MNILGIDSSGNTASVAYITDGVVKAEFNINNKKTHSETLLPMIDTILKAANIDMDAIDMIAVAAGPGSFTGLRIGASTVKGLGLALDKEVIPVPTLHGLAYNVSFSKGVVAPIMDARRNQVYAGIYRTADDIEVIMDQDALDIHDFIEKINETGEEVTFTGDGISVFKDIIEEELKVPYHFAPAGMNRQRAASIAALGEIYAKKGLAVKSDDFSLIYLRKSQAEREREERLKQGE